MIEDIKELWAEIGQAEVVDGLAETGSLKKGDGLHLKFMRRGDEFKLVLARKHVVNMGLCYFKHPADHEVQAAMLAICQLAAVDAHSIGVSPVLHSPKWINGVERFVMFGIRELAFTPASKPPVQRQLFRQ